MAPVIVLFCLAAAAVLIALIAHSFRTKTRQPIMSEPRGDWWPHFEAEFRAYAERWEASRSARPKRPASQQDR
jgi:hypothetical protein